jgi:predicted deacylase
VSQAPIRVGGVDVEAGERKLIDLPVPPLYTHTALTIPVRVIHGRRTGPRLFVCAAIHGDEINGVEIIRRVINSKGLDRLCGTLLAVPVVNIYGFINQSRYLPDRRDLNRCFPGSETGPLAARLAHVFFQEIVALCTHGIDLHTGAIHRDNYPHVRACIEDCESIRMARAFAAPVILNTALVEGSMRQALARRGIPVVVYEAGEALRFDEEAIRIGAQGVGAVMQAIGMLPSRPGHGRPPEPAIAGVSGWVRAPQSGILRSLAPLGERVGHNQLLGIVADPFGEREAEVRTPAAGMIVGRTNLPLVNEGEALFHVARFEALDGGDTDLIQDPNPNAEALLREEAPVADRTP